MGSDSRMNAIREYDSWFANQKKSFERTSLRLGLCVGFLGLGPSEAPRPRGPKSQNNCLNTHEMGLYSKFQPASLKTLACVYERHFSS